MADNDLFTHEIAKKRFVRAYRLFVGRGKKFSIDDLEKATGITGRTLRSYQEGQNAPDHTSFLALCSILPEHFLNMVLEPTGKGGVMDMDVGRATPFEVAQHASHFCTTLMQAMEDERIDHQEEHQLDTIAANLMPVLSKWLTRKHFTSRKEP